MQTWKRKKTANLRLILIFWTYLSRRVVSLVVRVLSLKRVNHTGFYHLAEATRKHQSTSRMSSFFSAHGSDFGWNWRTTVQNNGEQNKKLGTLHFKGRERHNVKSTTHTQSMRRGVSPNRPGRQTDGARWISQGSFQNTKYLKPLCAIQLQLNESHHFFGSSRNLALFTPELSRAQSKRKMTGCTQLKHVVHVLSRFPVKLESSMKL